MERQHSPSYVIFDYMYSKWQVFCEKQAIHLDFSRHFGYKRSMKSAAIILAAGKGSRMKSALPKPLHMVGGRPMLAWAIDSARACAADRIITVLPADSETTQTWLGDQEFVIQDPPQGTGHAVQMASNALADFDGVALIMFADTPLITAATLSALSAQVVAGADVAVLGFEAADPTGYGRIIPGENDSVSAIIEHKDATEDQRAITLCNGGIMAVRCPMLFSLLDAIDANNAQGEIYLTDIVGIAAARGARTVCCVADEAEVMGVNDRADLAAAEAELQNRLRSAAMAAGVTMVAPETTFLHAETVIEPDVIIEPHVVIGSATHIGSGSIIKSFSHIEGATLGPCCVIGPYARLRPGTVAEEGVKIGNFVETKNTQLGAGAKANHLTYLGDSEIGATANIGAGTITCNYDGYNKYKTLIGDGAFIGSNTSLIAPVTVGAGAIIGAGSTISQNVDGNDLAVARAKAKVMPGAAETLRNRNAARKAAAKAQK